jgi:glycosyltransferase involved in cell wall biosynthesis
MGREDRPLVSIISFCKNRASTIRRSIDSVLGQSYEYLEFVVQDGASTDGTLEILREYEDPRIKLVSARDAGPGEAFLKVLRRCEGTIVGTCLSDEELLPGAVARAVEMLSASPRLGAVTCDGYFTDPAGRITGPFIAGAFDFVNYLFGRYCPFWAGTFFRRQALLDIGLASDDWPIDSLEFEIWCRMAARHEVQYFPVFMSKYGVDPTQLSNTPESINVHLNGRVAVIDRLFSDEGFAGADERKKLACLYNQHYLFYSHARAYALREQTEAIYDRMMPLLEALDPPQWRTRRALPRADAVNGLNAPAIPDACDGDFARLYYARGQVHQALQMWRRSNAPEDADSALIAVLCHGVNAVHDDSVVNLELQSYGPCSRH